MRKYTVRATEQRVYYNMPEPVFVEYEIDADTFKVNDQGTVIFTTGDGASVASFKAWTTIVEG